MVATPMRLDQALRMNGYTIDLVEFEAFTIPLDEGVVAVPAMVGSKLTWRRDTPPLLGSALFLDKLPAFHPDYQPILLSHILDRYASRRIGYNTPDEFATAVRRWGNEHLGPFSILNQRYRSTAVDLPLTTVDLIVKGEQLETTSGSSTSEDNSTTNDDATTTDNSSGTDTATSNDTGSSTTKGRDADSDFPQGVLAGSTDYASRATDRAGTTAQTANGTTTGGQTRNGEVARIGEVVSESTNVGSSTGRRDGLDERTELGRVGVSAMRLLAERREAMINTDSETLEAFNSLFLSMYDLGEYDDGVTMPYSGYSFPLGRW